LVGNSSTTGALTPKTNSSVTMSGGNLYASSDDRLKIYVGDVKIDFEQLLDIPKRYFKWKKEGPQGKTMIGTSAQKLMESYPELVNKNKDGMHSVAYDRLGVIALAAIDKLHEENEELREEIKKLKERVEKLEG
jgi:squalene cyclase